MTTHVEAKPCATCGQYKVANLTTDAGVLHVDPKTKQLQVLLIERGREPFKGCLAFPGGFVDYGEDPKIGVLRELKEETSLVGTILGLVDVRGDPKRDPRKHIVSIMYAIEVKDISTLRADDDAATAKFYNVEDVKKKQMAFDHRQFLDSLLEFHKDHDRRKKQKSSA